MRNIVLSGLILLCSIGRADPSIITREQATPVEPAAQSEPIVYSKGPPEPIHWVKGSCKYDKRKMGNTRGLITSVKSCGNKKICQIDIICRMVDSKTLDQYGSTDKMPAEVLKNETYQVASTDICLTEGDHCPELAQCDSNDPTTKYNKGLATAYDTNKGPPEVHFNSEGVVQ